MKFIFALLFLALMSCGRALDHGKNSYIVSIEHGEQLEEQNVDSGWLWFLYFYLGGASWIER